MINILLVLFVIGWFSPKISIFTNITASMQDFICLLILIKYLLTSKIKLVKLYTYEIIFCLILFLISIKELIFFDSLYGLFYSLRIASYILVGSFIFADKKINHTKILYYSLILIFFILGLEVFNVLYYFLTKGFDLNIFLFGYDANLRVNNFFETGTTSIPLGYLAVILFAVSINLNKKFFILMSSLISLFTGSRGSWLSIIFVYFNALISRRINSSKLMNLIFLIIAFFFIYFFYLKIFPTYNSIELDYSSSLRLTMFKSSIKESILNPMSLLFGNVINPIILEKIVKFSFYESFNFHSLIQGGVLLFILSFLIYYKNFKYLRYHQATYLIFGIIISNLLAGNNYFSVYSYPLMTIFFAYLNNKKNNLKN